MSTRPVSGSVYWDWNPITVAVASPVTESFWPQGEYAAVPVAAPAVEAITARSPCRFGSNTLTVPETDWARGPSGAFAYRVVVPATPFVGHGLAGPGVPVGGGGPRAWSGSASGPGGRSRR